MQNATTEQSRSPVAEVIYEYAAEKPRYPYLLLRSSADYYYKVLVRGSFLFITRGSKVIDRGRGELDIPHAGAEWKPVGDFLYASPSEAQAAFARFRASPSEMLARVRAGRKP